MDWGSWEGKTLTKLRNSLGSQMKNIENLGLDMLPENGETPRNVQSRVISWLEDLDENTHIAITHKGVIRATLALATKWKMIGKAPAKIRSGNGYVFSFISRSNITFDNIISLNKV